MSQIWYIFIISGDSRSTDSDVSISECASASKFTSQKKWIHKLHSSDGEIRLLLEGRNRLVDSQVLYLHSITLYKVQAKEYSRTGNLKKFMEWRRWNPCVKTVVRDLRHGQLQDHLMLILLSYVNVIKSRLESGTKCIISGMSLHSNRWFTLQDCKVNFKASW